MNGWALIQNGKVQTVIRQDVSTEYLDRLRSEGFTVVADDQIPEGVSPQDSVGPTIEETLSGGYLDEQTGFRIRATLADQDTYSRLLSMLNSIETRGGLAAIPDQTFVDYSGVPHTMPAANFLDLMIRYGSLCARTMYPSIR